MEEVPFRNSSGSSAPYYTSSRGLA